MIDTSHFWSESEFIRTWDVRVTHGKPSEDELASLLKDWDPFLVELWRLHGWSTYGNGFLITDDPSRLTLVASEWLERLGVSGKVFARTAWGHFFVFNGASTLIIDPIFATCFDMHTDPVTLFDVFLATEDFLNDRLLHDVYSSAIQLLGREPDINSCACFIPAIALGGVIDPAAVQIRPLLPSLHILAQM